MSALLVATALLLGARHPARAASNDLWQSQSIYQIITDRFYDGDPANNNADGNYDPAGHRGTSVHGGDFKGIEQKLDYVKALGATAIWISPVVLNVRGEFHGYAARDFYKVDPHWGTLRDLRRMVKAAHARGLLVIDDIVVNHGGELIDSADPGYPKFKYPPAGYNLRYRDPARQFAPPFNLSKANPALTNLFHNNGVIQNYNDDIQVELGELSGLNDFRTETPYVRTQMTKIYEYWIKEAGFDGYRIDTVRHVEMGFWQTWCPAIHAYAARHGKPDFFLFGEVEYNSDAKCGSYTGTMGGGPFKLDSVLDYTLWFKINSVFGRADGPTKQLADHYAAVASNYDATAEARLVTFLDNHDQPRFLSPRYASNNVDRLKVALTFLYTAQGIPCLYYGTEQGFNGRKDPYDREDMFAGQFEWGPSLGDNFNMTHPLFQFVARLNNFRRLYPALQTGTQSIVWSNAAGPGLFAYTRHRGTQEVLIACNTSGGSQTMPGTPSRYPAGTPLVNLLDAHEIVTIAPDQTFPPLTLNGTSAKIFVAQSELQALDPMVTAISPAHDAHGISPAAPLVIHFSQPMNTRSVDKAFSTEPQVRGVCSWSPAADELTFTPRGKGWPSAAMIHVRLAGSAKDTTGRPLPGGFEARFQTGGM